MAESNNEFDQLRDAEEYVESVMSSQVSAVVRTPLANLGGRKRQLSMPDESAIKKVNGDTAHTRAIFRAKRARYENGTSEAVSPSQSEGEATEESRLQGKNLNQIVAF